MPENEIAFIHDADSESKKSLLFRDLQNGLVSVVIGSTFKMGLGVNVQKRLCALHHLDVPWRPADMVQREGRILRQGNECGHIEIHRYITKGSFDAYSWQLLESKQRFISQILSGHITVREGEDVDETVLNYAEVKALAVGNPLIKRRVELVNDLDKYKILHRDYIEDRMKKKRTLSELPELIEKQTQRIEKTKQDIAFVAANGNNYKEMEYEEQKAIRDAIYAAVKTHINKPFERKILTYQGFDVVVPARMQPKMPNAKDEKAALLKEPIPYVYVKRCGTYYMEIESNAGITKRLNNLLENLDFRRENMEKELDRLKFQKEMLENELSTESSSYLEEIEELTKEIQKIDEELGLKTA
jgi:predicted  nucleic acid-binding Zn-ribbon protein